MEPIVNRFGYLLIEMMIVLLIIGIISAVAYPRYDSFIKNRKTEYFIDSFQREVTHMQQRAITEGRIYSLTIDNKNHFYEVRGYGSNKPVKRFFPEFITFEGHSMLLSVQFNQYGNISRAGTLFIHSGNHSYKMVFQIGKGKFYVTKQ
ncbi:prepilin-type N-terminal cleavage/methylation domain-containing protein [Fictibacillus nanhaiensis]|uniref:competence type IV pilus minor pilin ComGD n=1 Tax=Fictibacillus nanhaiensis TaxID=742169 RepID=UPI001C95A941|nr:competence type IV pilus minor pilin ComGD [Fictibacillus nanhaiensis]MBY6035518.1 prepilin-type N-terminal cleavage/methylation domain-containing protein [Fictibacillus nanhaiensis]